MNICPNCGAPLKRYYRVCEYCGCENETFQDIGYKYCIKITTPFSLKVTNSVPDEIVNKGYKQLLNYLATKIKVLRRDDICNCETEYLFYIQ